MQEDGGTPSRRRIRWRSDDADSDRLVWDLRMVETKGHMDRPPVGDDDAAVDDDGADDKGDDDDGGGGGDVDLGEVEAIRLLRRAPTAST